MEVRKWKIGTNMINRGDVVRDGAKAECPVTDQFDLVVQALQSAIGNTQSGPGQDAVDVGAHESSELLHRFQAAVAGFPEPTAEEALGVEGMLVMPEKLEVFFQQVSPHETEIDAG